MPQCVAVILDGGSGTRMGGVQKGLLRLENIPLGIRVLDRVRNGADVVLYSRPADGWSPEGAVALDDDPDGLSGPAAGLQAAARWCEVYAPNALLITASGDAPFMPLDFIERARGLLGGETGCVVGAYRGRDYPTAAVWRASRLSSTLKMFEAGPKGPSLRVIAEAAGSHRLDYAGLLSSNPFIGVNTVAELLALEARATA